VLLCLTGIVVLSLVIRIAVAIATTSWVFSDKNNFFQFGFEMGQISESIASGGGFSWPEEVRRVAHIYPGQPTAWMPPVYPLIVAAAFEIFGVYSKQSAMALELFQTGISVLNCVLLYILGKRLYTAQAGLVAAFLLCVYPQDIHFAVQKIWMNNLFVCCLLLLILMLLHMADRPHMKRGIYLGIMLGFTALIDPVITGVYPFVFVWLYLKADTDRLTILKITATILITFFFTISPWLVRNYTVFGKFIFIKSSFGYNLYLGNREGASGGYKDVWLPEYFSESEQKYLNQSKEPARSSFFLRKAMTFIMEDPLSFVQRTMNRIIRFWTHIRPIRGWGERIAVAAYFIVLILAVVGLTLNRAKRRDVSLLLLFVLLLPVPYYLTQIIFYRYRFPIEPILMVFAGYTIYWFACRWGKIFIHPLLVFSGKKRLS
jgi:4-amino-4-deoxy-L-arabinose transferase-like glycosyltransferase